ncbi:MAG: S41 family peptidase [Thermaerobacter sp.]|nr:S41 family peptidase [Thermaerobacter sp.]
MAAITGRALARTTPAAVFGGIRGTAGWSLTAAVSRSGIIRSLRVTRSTMSLPTVYNGLLASHIGYLAITEFAKHSGQGTAAEFQRLMDRGTSGTLRALRNNAGGETSQVLQAATLLVPPRAVTLRHQNPPSPDPHDSPGAGPRLPVAAMVNGHAATGGNFADCDSGAAGRGAGRNPDLRRGRCTGTDGAPRENIAQIDGSQL